MYGKSEERIGPWMEDHREDFFLATKTRSRTYDGAWANLERSLENLRVDYVDLWQMHGLTNPAGWERAMGSGGTLEAFIEAQEKKLVRFLGVTGHGSKVAGVHLRSLERFKFESVLLPYSFWQMQHKKYAADFKELVEVCQKRNIALQTIKSVARRPWDNRDKTHNTYFYEPLTTQESIDKAVHWALGFSDCFVITAGDIRLLPKMLDAANRFEQRPSDIEMHSLMEEFGILPIFSY
jgi:aryl-alcohol dehydrogenase-like predicted oxidoreductase